MITDVDVGAFLTFEALMFQTLILVPAAKISSFADSESKILAAGTKIEGWNIKNSNVKNASTSTLIIIFVFRSISIFEVVSSIYAFNQTLKI